MLHHVAEVVDLAGTGRTPRFRDARTLKEAVRQSIRTSPGSFLKTLDEVEIMSGRCWDGEVSGSTWVVIQESDTVVGTAVARLAGADDDFYIDPVRTRYIESVWIAPRFRGSHMGERLVNYLIEVERQKYPSVTDFLLWVFENNDNAVRLYERMLFSYVGKHALGDNRIEQRYKYVLPSLSAEEAAQSSKENKDARDEDWRNHGVTYRVLGPDIA